jgi:hypothetical protein
VSHANYGEAFAPQIAAQFNIRTWSPIALSPLRILAVVAVRERWRHALVAPTRRHFSAEEKIRMPERTQIYSLV